MRLISGLLGPSTLRIEEDLSRRITRWPAAVSITIETTVGLDAVLLQFPNSPEPIKRIYYCSNLGCGVSSVCLEPLGGWRRITSLPSCLLCTGAHHVLQTGAGGHHRKVFADAPTNHEAREGCQDGDDQNHADDYGRDAGDYGRGWPKARERRRWRHASGQDGFTRDLWGVRWGLASVGIS